MVKKHQCAKKSRANWYFNTQE